MAHAASASPVSDSQSKVSAVNGQLKSAQAQADALEQQLQSDGQRLDVLSQQYDGAQQQVQQINSQLVSTKAQVAQTQASVNSAESNLRQQALTQYMSGATDTAIENFFSPSGEQASAAEVYRRIAGANVSGAIDRLHSAQLALEAQQSELQETEAQATAAASQVASEQQQAQLLAQSQQSALGQVKGQVATLVTQLQAAQQAEQEAAFEARLAAERAAEAAAATASAQGGSALVSNAPVSPGAPGAVQAAESQLGVPYVWGGESPKGSSFPGFDCSGLTQWSWRQAGVSLPRTAQEQYDSIVHIPLSQLQPGDLLFWDDGTNSVQHVAMYIGNNTVIQAPETGETVSYSPVWDEGLVGAGRP